MPHTLDKICLVLVELLQPLLLGLELGEIDGVKLGAVAQGVEVGDGPVPHVKGVADVAQRVRQLVQPEGAAAAVPERRAHAAAVRAPAARGEDEPVLPEVDAHGLGVDLLADALDDAKGALGGEARGSGQKGLQVLVQARVALVLLAPRVSGDLVVAEEGDAQGRRDEFAAGTGSRGTRCRRGA